MNLLSTPFQVLFGQHFIPQQPVVETSGEKIWTTIDESIDQGLSPCFPRSGQVSFLKQKWGPILQILFVEFSKGSVKPCVTSSELHFFEFPFRSIRPLRRGLRLPGSESS